VIARPVASRTTIVRHKGRITNWNDDRGFGFITPATGGEQVFVHIKSFVNRGRRPAGSDIVTYEVTRDRKGRSQGVNVAYAGERSPPTSAAKPLPGSEIGVGYSFQDEPKSGEVLTECWDYG